MRFIMGWLMFRRIRALFSDDLDKLESRVLFLERRLRGLEHQLLANLSRNLKSEVKPRSATAVARKSAK